MKRSTLLLCFLVGAGVLAYLIHRVGFGALVAEARQTDNRLHDLIAASCGNLFLGGEWILGHPSR